MSRRRFVLRLLALAIVLQALRTFVARPFQVITGSMEPTLHADGEWVLVQLGGVDGLERYDLVMLDRGGGEAPFIKRVAGLPGERLRLADGDLWVDGQRPTGAEAPWIPLFDSERHDLAGAFHFRPAPEGPWSPTAAGGLRLEGADLATGVELGLLLLHEELRDGRLDAAGERVPGQHQVNDGRVTARGRVESLAEGGRLRARLVEEADVFEAVLARTADGARLALERHPGAEVLAEVAAPDPEGRGFRLVFSNRDDRLRARLEVDGAEPVEVEARYEANRPYTGVIPEGLRSIAPRVAFGGEGVVLELEHLAIDRDLYWVALGTHGVAAPVELGPQEVFLLGDNSADSADSRLWGPVPIQSLRGRPLLVVWPPGAWRRPR